MIFNCATYLYLLVLDQTDARLLFSTAREQTPWTVFCYPSGNGHQTINSSSEIHMQVFYSLSHFSRWRCRFAFCFSTHTSFFTLSVIFILRAAHYHCYCLTICVYRSKSARGYLFFWLLSLHYTRSLLWHTEARRFSRVLIFLLSYFAQSRHKRPNTHTPKTPNTAAALPMHHSHSLHIGYMCACFNPFRFSIARRRRYAKWCTFLSLLFLLLFFSPLVSVWRVHFCLFWFSALL